MKNIGITSVWEDLDDKLLTPGQLQGYPWKLCVWRFKLAMWKVGGIKIESAAGRQKFLPKWNGTLWKMENFRKSVRRRKFSMWKFFRDSTMLKLSSRGFRKCGTFWACELLKWSYCCSKSDDVGRTRVASKIRVVLRKSPRSQFWLLSKILLRGFFYIYLKNPLRGILLSSQNCDRGNFSLHHLFLLATRVLPTSSDFEQQ